MAGMLCIGLRHGGHCAEWESSMDGWLNDTAVVVHIEKTRNLFDAYPSLVFGVIQRIALEQVGSCSFLFFCC
jgi:hypothetical protein